MAKEENTAVVDTEETSAELASDPSPATQPPEAQEDDDELASHDHMAAFEQRRVEIDAVPDSQAVVINTDVGTAVQGVLATVRHLEPLVDDLTRETPTFDLRGLLGRLHTMALALNYLQSQYRILLITRDDEQIVYLRNMRQLLQLDAEALAARGLLNRAQVDELKHTNNHHALAYDVMGLAGLILGVYDDPRVRLMTTRQELLEASRRANELFTQLGTRQFGANAGDEVKVLRRKAFALMLQLFTELESFITFARRKQRDAKAFLAPLYAKRGRKGNGSQGVEDTEDDDSPSSPPGQSSDGLPFDVEELNRNVAAATVGAGEVVRPGFPGGLAFLPEDQAESKDKAK